MKLIENLPLTRTILKHLSDLYQMEKLRTGVHLSTLIYCLTKGYYDVTDPLPPTDREVLLYSVGLGLERILNPSGEHGALYEKDGIQYSPDFIYKPAIDQVLGELKTTRMSAKLIGEKGLPETWIEYMKGGCYMLGTTTYDLSAMLIIAPELKSWRIEFEPAELELQWNIILARKAVYLDAIATRTRPEPKLWCKDWECNQCRYAIRCEVK